jgi:hypothetical protein
MFMTGRVADSRAAHRLHPSGAMDEYVGYNENTETEGESMAPAHQPRPKGSRALSEPKIGRHLIVQILNIRVLRSSHF